MKTEEAALAVAGVASKTTYSGAGLTFGGFLFTNEFAVLVGIFAAVGGLLVNWYYRRQAELRAEKADAAKEARDQVLFEMRQEWLKNGRNPLTDFGGLGEEDD